MKFVAWDSESLKLVFQYFSPCIYHYYFFGNLCIYVVTPTCSVLKKKSKNLPLQLPNLKYWKAGNARQRSMPHTKAA